MRTLRLHSTGEDVRAWQEFLQRSGFYEGAIDRVFGERTSVATRRFQELNGLKVDGVAGNKTLGAAMQRGLDLAPEDPPPPDHPGGLTLNDDWSPPPPPADATDVCAQDPRVITNHRVRELPCPRNPRAPVGWARWQGNEVPQGLTEFAVNIKSQPEKFPMGTFVQTLFEGRLVAARVEWHSYKGATGERGCFRGVNLFHSLMEA